MISPSSAARAIALEEAGPDGFGRAALERFASLRRCLGCGHPQPRSEGTSHAPCEACGRVPICPDPAEWPAEVWRHQQLLLVERFTRQHRGPDGKITADGKRAVLVANYRGTWVGTGADRFLIPFFGTTADDVYVLALQAARTWASAQRR